MELLRAFIGYTQCAVNKEGNSLLNIPTNITSQKEYEEYFGTAENETGITANVHISITAAGKAHPAECTVEITNPSLHIMHYSLRLFFAHGGTSCYVVSVGATSSPPVFHLSDFKAGLTTLSECDEVTLIVFPEGRGLAEQEYYDLVSDAIDLCALLRNRFTLIDFHSLKSDTATTINNFRNVAPHTTGFSKKNNLSYAAVYYPDLKTFLDYSFKKSDVKVIVITSAIGVEDSAETCTLDTLEVAQPDIFTIVINAISSKLHATLPPTPAIVGVYSTVDHTRGGVESTCKLFS